MPVDLLTILAAASLHLGPAAPAAAPPAGPGPSTGPSGSAVGPATGPAVGPAAAPAAGATPVVPASAAVVVDAVLPCGLRVLTARDMSLPVAAVVLAIESGSEDDPPESPGLVHALAYQLLQGNRELRPGEAIAAAQDAGGLHSFATGPAQVRFESLVPVTRLDVVLWVESQRLRFPTTAPQRWQQSLGWAASDERVGSRLRPEAFAFIHGVAGLGHDGRAVDKSLAGLAEGVLASHLANKFNYARATLVVVAPESPERMLERIKPLFAGLPQTRRLAPVRRLGPRPASGAAAPPGAPPGAPTGSGDMSEKPAAPAPTGMSSGTGATVPLARQRGHTFAWPVPATPAAGAWAAAICRSINRQKKGPEPEEARKARLSCEFEGDPRRAVLMLRPSNADDPWALVRARLARLAPGGADTALLASQAATVAQAMRLAQRSPQGLAQQLAFSAADEIGGPRAAFTSQHRVEDITGVAALADPASLQREAPGLLRVEDAIVLTLPEAKP